MRLHHRGLQHGLLRRRELIQLDVAPGNDVRIPFVRFAVHDRGVAGRASLSLPTLFKRLHVLAMFHDQSRLFERPGEVPGRDFRDPQHIAMARQTDFRIDLGVEFVGFFLGAE